MPWERTSVLKKLITEINDIVVVFLNYVVTKFGPIAIFVLLSRTFAIYGIHHLKPAMTYVVATTILLLAFLFVGYPLFVAASTRLNPFKFASKILKVAVFGFSTSSSAATLPLNVKTTVEELGVDEKTAAEDACKAEHILSEQTLEKIRESALRNDAAHPQAK